MISFDGFPIDKFAKSYTGPGRQLRASANNKGHMKKVKSLEDLQRLMETLGATKETEPGFTSWTLDCGPGHKLQAASAIKQTQSKGINKT